MKWDQGDSNGTNSASDVNLFTEVALKACQL